MAAERVFRRSEIYRLMCGGILAEKDIHVLMKRGKIHTPPKPAMFQRKLIGQQGARGIRCGGGWIREPRTEKQSTGLFFPTCGRDVLFSSHPPKPQTKNLCRQTTEVLFVCSDRFYWRPRRERQ